MTAASLVAPGGKVVGIDLSSGMLAQAGTNLREAGATNVEFVWCPNAFAFDIGVHAAVDASPWLESRAWVLGAGVLAVAGAGRDYVRVVAQQNRTAYPVRPGRFHVVRRGRRATVTPSHEARDRGGDRDARR